MALSQKLEIRQSQSLVMTPQLMQAIKLLQLSNLDLIAYVDAELERNPLLERPESEDAAPGAAPDEAGKPGDPGSDESPDWLETDPDPIESQFEADFDADFPHDAARSRGEAGPPLQPESWSSGGSQKTIGSGDYNLEAFVAGETSLSDHLAEQLGVAVSDPWLRVVGQAVINEIDDAGYLRADVTDVAQRLGATIGQVEQAVAIVQTFEPTGVGARDLAECLAIQLKERNRFDPAMAALVANLDLVARRDHAALMRICDVDAEDLADMLAEIKALDPRPGGAIGRTVVQPLIPDVLVRPAPDGSWHVELNAETLPRVLVNQSYSAVVARQRHNDKDKAFLAECLQTANWLVKSLDQRARTILKVATEIVRQQDAFLVHGIAHLRPLNLKTVAEAIGMHESTVSRVTSNKYMATTRGIFEMKYFFTAAIASAAGGDAHSAEAVRYRIKHLIDGEAANAILSDDTIVRLLRDSGVDIARRTVAKYREAMRIPSSVQRRRDKQVSL